MGYILLLDKTVTGQLTVREMEVAKYAVRGLTNEQIAAKLGISLSAVKQYVSVAMEKVGAKGRNDLSRFI